MPVCLCLRECVCSQSLMEAEGPEFLRAGVTGVCIWLDVGAGI